MTKLPKRSKSQEIGVSAADLLSSVFTKFCNVIPVPQDKDLGIDFICEIMQGGNWSRYKYLACSTSFNS